MSQSDPKTNMSTARDQRRDLYDQLVGKPIAGDRFRITRLLGFGGMGAVYEALQLNMNRPVALKLIPTHDPTTVARFEREALTISQLRHPNTITVFDYGRTEEGFLFLSMELLHGQTLSEVVKSVGPLPPRRAIHIASQICRSLNEAHHAGIVHRDIKPDNIILITVDSDDSVVKVLDFGIAKAVMGDDDVQLTGDGRIIGTPRYMSPEQILAESLDHRSDIYSLGCIIFEMLTGVPPFQQSSTTALMISHTQDPPPAFAQRLSGPSLEKIPPYLEGVVRRALAKDPNDRPQTTDELRIELEEAMNSVPVGQSQAYLTARNTASQSGLLVAQPVQTGNFAQHPITGSFNAPMQNPSSSMPVPVLFAPVVEEPEKSSNVAPLVAIFGLLLMAGAAGVYLMRSDVEPKPEVVATTATVVEVSKPPVQPSVEAKPAFASVEFSTTPAGAHIFQGEEDTGKVTPALIALPIGKRVDMTFKLSGYRDYEAQIVPEKGMTIDSKMVRVSDPVQKIRHVSTVKPVPTPEKDPDPVVVPKEPTPTRINILPEDDGPTVPMLN